MEEQIKTDFTDSNSQWEQDKKEMNSLESKQDANVGNPQPAIKEATKEEKGAASGGQVVQEVKEAPPAAANEEAPKVAPAKAAAAAPLAQAPKRDSNGKAVA